MTTDPTLTQDSVRQILQELDEAQSTYDSVSNAGEASVKDYERLEDARLALADTAAEIMRELVTKAIAWRALIAAEGDSNDTEIDALLEVAGAMRMVLDMVGTD